MSRKGPRFGLQGLVDTQVVHTLVNQGLDIIQRRHVVTTPASLAGTSGSALVYGLLDGLPGRSLSFAFGHSVVLHDVITYSLSNWYSSSILSLRYSDTR